MVTLDGSVDDVGALEYTDSPHPLGDQVPDEEQCVIESHNCHSTRHMTIRMIQLMVAVVNPASWHLVLIGITAG